MSKLFGNNSTKVSQVYNLDATGSSQGLQASAKRTSQDKLSESGDSSSTKSRKLSFGRAVSALSKNVGNLMKSEETRRKEALQSWYEETAKPVRERLVSEHEYEAMVVAGGETSKSVGSSDSQNSIDELENFEVAKIDENWGDETLAAVLKNGGLRQ